jgi:hypothetical protein
MKPNSHLSSQGALQDKFRVGDWDFDDFEEPAFGNFRPSDEIDSIAALKLETDGRGIVDAVEIESVTESLFIRRPMEH